MSLANMRRSCSLVDLEPCYANVTRARLILSGHGTSRDGGMLYVELFIFNLNQCECNTNLEFYNHLGYLKE